MEGGEMATIAVATTPKKLARQLNFTAVLHGPAQQFPVQSPPRPSLLTATIPESPRPRHPTTVLEIKDSSPKKQKQCNCKNSRCLKLYCECFASGIYCNGCNCLNCHNNVDHEGARQDAVGVTLERNPNAFRRKIDSSPHGSQVGKQEVGPAQAVVKHDKRCNCKKSGCLKNYCECFQSNVLCSDNCKCLDCKNSEGNEERRLIHRRSYNNMVYQAAISAVNGTNGSSGNWNSPVSRKMKDQDNIDMNHYQPFLHNAPFSQGNYLKSTTPSLSPMPVSRGSNAQAFSKAKYRSLLAGVIQPESVKELCSLLVFVSKESAQAFADKNSKSGNQEGGDEVETSCHFTLEGKMNGLNKPACEKDIALNNLADEQAVRMSADDSGLGGSELQNDRPDSPGTMALMCYEQDTDFTEGGSPRIPNIDSQSMPPETSTEQKRSESYVEQEKVVLTKFRDFLNRLITHGSIKETMCSSQARNELETQGQPLRSDAFKDIHFGNGVKTLVPVSSCSPAKIGDAVFGSTNIFTQISNLPLKNRFFKSMNEETINPC